MNIDSLLQHGPCEWRIAPTGKMNVPVVIYATEALVRDMDEKVREQALNVACLPGIVHAACVMEAVRLPPQRAARFGRADDAFGGERSKQLRSPTGKEHGHCSLGQDAVGKHSSGRHFQRRPMGNQHAVHPRPGQRTQESLGRVDHRFQVIAGIFVRDQIHRDLDLLLPERQFRGVAGAKHRTRQDLVQRDAQRPKRVAQSLGLANAVGRKISLTTSVAQAASIDFALIGSRVAEIDHLSAVLDGGNKHLSRRLGL